MYQIICYVVLTALPNHYSWRMGIDFAGMVNVIIEDDVALIDVFGSRTVTAKQNASTSNVFNMIPNDSVFLSVQVHTYCGAATMDKVTLLNRAILGTTQADQGVGLVVHLPVVLQTRVVFSPQITLSMFECKTTKDEITHRSVLRAPLVDQTL